MLFLKAYTYNKKDQVRASTIEISMIVLSPNRNELQLPVSDDDTHTCYQYVSIDLVQR